MYRAMGNGLLGALVVFLVSVSLPSDACAGFCCLSPGETCTTAEECGEGPCGPPCDDHLMCYRISSSVRLQGVVDVDTKQLGLEPGCSIVGPKLFCVPATKTVKEAFDTSTSPPTPIDPGPIVGPPAPGDRICYKVLCERSSVPEQIVEDQFGIHRIQKLKPSLLCTPAVKRPPEPKQCGETWAECNGLCPPGERCSEIPESMACECRTAPPPCTSDDGCPAGEICVEGECVGCVCPLIWDPVCGVDGVTYGNACEARCAHVEIAHRGECAEACACNRDCPQGRACRENRCQEPCEILCLVYDPVCGSDGKTYGCGAADAACHGVRVLHEGECRATCTSNDQCESGSFCAPPPVCPDPCGCASFCVPCICPDIWDPVCGVDGVTYGNPCEARCAHVEIAHPGECESPPGAP